MARADVGETAPDFTLPWTGEGEFSLADRRGRWVVLAFYPGDFTPTCTKQFCDYRDGREEIDGLDAEVVGISPQDVDSHQRFIAEHGLTVPLAADVDKAVAKAYGVLAPGGAFVRRAIIVIDPAGVIRDRTVALLGLGYEDTGDLRSALERARAAA
jgi:thioredoxin-dependent peroxiredoxin